MKRDKKVLLSLLAIASFILLILIINRVYAEESIPGMPFGLSPETIEKAPQTPEEAKNVSIAWIKKNWAENLRNENSFLGKFMSPILKGYDKISPYTDPIFKFILGIEPQLSWLFFLTLVIWIDFFILFIRLSEFLPFSQVVSYIIAIGFGLTVSISGIPLAIGQLIINAIVKFATTWWMQLIVIIVAMAIFILFASFNKEFKKYIEEVRKRRKEIQQEVDIDILKKKDKLREELEKV